MFKDIQDNVFKCEDLVNTSFYHFNILVHTGVETLAGTEMCELCAELWS